MTENLRADILKAYEEYIPTNTSIVERIFGIVLIVLLGLAVGVGILFHSVKNLPEVIQQNVQEIQARFILDEKKPIERKESPKLVVKEKKEPVDLTKKPVMNQKVEDASVKPQPQAPVAPRRVYGLRRVYSVGIGASGAQSDAVIGKLGNTINKDFDTLTATHQDLKGTLVPVTMITTAPVQKAVVKPVYTKEMIDAKIEGVIKAELLIDVDGHVKDVRILNDLGYGTKESARAAFLQWTFEPAKQGNEARAVWISYSVRFVLLTE